MRTTIEIGQFVMYDCQEYEVLDKTPDGNLILGNNLNAIIETEATKVFLKNDNGFSPHNSVTDINKYTKRYIHRRENSKVSMKKEHIPLFNRRYKI